MPFPVEKVQQGTEYFSGWWVLGAVAAIGASYGVWEWREEIMQVGRRAHRFVWRGK